MFGKYKTVYILVFFILFIGAFLRFYKLDEIPFAVNHDELSNIYDGYSIAETGADRWGVKHPFLLRGFGEGDNRPPLYSWICAGSIKLFGYSITSGRAPAGLIGLISLLLLFFVARKIGGELFAILSLLLATFSPWHMLFSRMALEAVTLPSFFILLSIWFWLKWKENKRPVLYLILLGFTIGFAVNAYQATKLIFFIIGFFVLIETFTSDFPKIKNSIILGVFMLIGAFPQIYIVVFQPEAFFSRASGTLMKFTFSIQYFLDFAKNIYTNISPEYLFLSFSYNNMSIARLLKFEMIFFYTGLLFFYKIVKPSSSFKAYHLYFIIFLALFPSSLTFNNPHALRASAVIILYPMVSVAGILFCMQFIKSQKVRYAFIGSITIAVLFFSTKFIYKYINNWDLKNASHQHEIVLMSEKVNQLKNDYSNIFIQNMGMQQYIYIASYCGIHPKDFQKMNKIYTNTGMDKFKKMGKYTFYDKGEISKDSLNKAGKNLIVSNFKQESFELIDSLDANVQKFYFYTY